MKKKRSNVHFFTYHWIDHDTILFCLEYGCEVLAYVFLFLIFLMYQMKSGIKIYIWIVQGGPYVSERFCEAV